MAEKRNQAAKPARGRGASPRPGAGEVEEVFVISVAAELAGMHAQTLRTYDRIGLVTPQRTRGGGRRYSRDDVETLRTIQRLSQDEGVNLAGIKEILALKEENRRLREENRRLQEHVEHLESAGARPRGELVHVPRSTAVVVWEQRRRRHD